jgi:hypothetical protein
LGFADKVKKEEMVKVKKEEKGKKDVVNPKVKSEASSSSSKSERGKVSSSKSQQGSGKYKLKDSKTLKKEPADVKMEKHDIGKDVKLEPALKEKTRTLEKVAVKKESGDTKGDEQNLKFESSSDLSSTSTTGIKKERERVHRKTEKLEEDKKTQLSNKLQKKKHETKSRERQKVTGSASLNKDNSSQLKAAKKKNDKNIKNKRTQDNNIDKLKSSSKKMKRASDGDSYNVQPKKKRAVEGGEDSVKEIAADIDPNDVMAVLMQMEGRSSVSKVLPLPSKPPTLVHDAAKPSTSGVKVKKVAVWKRKVPIADPVHSESSELSEWEEVEGENY